MGRRERRGGGCVFSAGAGAWFSGSKLETRCGRPERNKGGC